MNFIIFAVLVTHVFGDHESWNKLDRVRVASSQKLVSPTSHHTNFWQEYDYDLPIQVIKKIFNPLHMSSETFVEQHQASEQKPERKVTFSSQSTNFKNKTTQTSSHVSQASGSISQDLPHKNVVSFISHHSSFSSHFSNRSRDGANKNNEKSVELTADLSSRISDNPDLFEYAIGSEHHASNGNEQTAFEGNNHITDDGLYRPDKYVDEQNVFENPERTTDRHDIFEHASIESQHHTANQLKKSDEHNNHGSHEANNHNHNYDSESHQLANTEGMHLEEYGTPAQKDNLNIKPHSVYGVPEWYKGGFKDNAEINVSDLERFIKVE